MASYIERGDSLFIPFRNGKSISDSQCRPRMYKSLQNFEKSFPKHNLGTENIEKVEYAEVKHGYNKTSMHPVDEFWCSECGFCCADYTETKYDEDGDYTYSCECEFNYCPKCGAKMDGGNAE